MKKQIKNKFDMNSKKTLKQFSLLVGGLMLGFTVSSTAQNGEAVFKQSCAMCHSVGKGRLVGPDLKGVTSKRSEDWLLKWTKSSQSLIKSGDADAKAIFDEFGGVAMPDQSLSDADIKSIFAYIGSNSDAAGASATAGAAAPSSDNATPEEIEKGKNIFTGAQALVNGGAACISCHNVDYVGVIPGGLLAKDLTTVHSRLGGDAGVQGILGAPPFPAMTQAYKDKAITDQEIAALTAFLNKVDKDTANQTHSKNPLKFGGLIGVGTLLVLIFGLWFGRKKYTVKKEIYNRQIKSV